MDNYLMHLGIGHLDDPPGRGSGRYGWGTGDNPYQHQNNFTNLVEKYRKEGMNDDDIAALLLGEHSRARDLKLELVLEQKRERHANAARALELYNGDCNGNVSEVGRRMGINESSVRELLKPAIDEKQSKYLGTAEYLKDRIARSESGIIEVGKNTEDLIGISTQTKMLAIRQLQDEGYTYTFVKLPQPTGKHETNTYVLASPDLTWADIQKNKFKMEPVLDFTPDGGKTFKTVNPPTSLDSKRIYIRYKEDGGIDKDGVVELRRNVPDLNLQGENYSQVRILVDGKYYMKGMAMYADDVPEGYDVIYNTNKKRGTKVFPDNTVESAVFKHIKADPDNPFGATIKPITAGGQYEYVDKDGKTKQSPINKVRSEGDWDDWNRKLASQFMSKQDIQLIKRQIDYSTVKKEAELDEIRSLTNPVIKQQLLFDYADQCDSDAVRLKTNGFKGSAFQVLLPITTLKNDEIYAPNYSNGDTVALVRYPHQGIFEIPILRVNNNNKDGKRLIGSNARDAVGINQYNADLLSGADFDGDTAVVIPLRSNNIKVKYAPKLKQLEDYDYKSIYKLPDSAPPVKHNTMQTQMGIITNLITDMSVSGGVSMDEISRAVKHSMLVVDSEKHHLDWKQSKKDNRISELAAKYQLSENGHVGGASTIFSRASSEKYVPQRKEVNDLYKMSDEEKKAWKAGKKVYHLTGKEVSDDKLIKDPSIMTEAELERYNAGKKVYRPTGKTKVVKEKVPEMKLYDDAMELVRDKNNPKEVAYANYANKLKRLGEAARKEAREMEFKKADPSAKVTYAKEIESLDRKLRIAESNSPKERLAMAIANNKIREKMNDSTIEWDNEHKQREKARAMDEARALVGAKKEPVTITDKEWEAIQSNAVAPTKLRRIIKNTDQDAFKQRALPKNSRELSAAQKARIKAYAESGNLTNQQIAEAMGISASTVSRVIKGE